MSDNTELFNALRNCDRHIDCYDCNYEGTDVCHLKAAETIEELEAEANKPITLEQAIDRLREMGWLQEHDRILTEPILETVSALRADVKCTADWWRAAYNDLKARLEEAENSVENYKRMWLEKHEPKTARWEGWTSTHWSKRCDSNGDPIYTEHTYYQCSYCGRRTVVRENFCPNCGAVMEDMCEVQK